MPGYGDKMKAMLLSLSVLFSATCALAAPSSDVVPYYGERFYLDLASGISNNDLKNSLKLVLKSDHRRVEGTYDQILQGCSGSGCYTQTSLGYDGARVYLLGNYYIVKHDDGSYGVRDVYCDKEKTKRDFPGKGPAPGTIPDNNVINIEHTWPQSKFSGRYNKGLQKADLHHLFPTDSHINSIRGNYQFGEVAQDTKTIECPVSRFGSASDGRTVFEPPANHKGNVARALFYFSIRYDLPITPNEEASLKQWMKLDPVDEDEIRRNEEIFKAQGNRNPFIDFPDLAERISDF